jgi:hypothetical protein
MDPSFHRWPGRLAVPAVALSMLLGHAAPAQAARATTEIIETATCR